MNVLLIGDNELRDLDKFLTFLTNFQYLEQLDLFGNPLAEEPDYRLKIIKLMPQIKTLDRHKVTTIERTKAAALVDIPMAKKKNGQKLLTEEQKKMKGFSKGEKDLYREVNKLHQAEAEKERAEMEKTAAYFRKTSYEGQPLPVPSKKYENKMKFGQNTEVALVEWEKNQIKPLFKEFDVDKKGIDKDKFSQLMERL